MKMLKQLKSSVILQGNVSVIKLLLFLTGNYAEKKLRPRYYVVSRAGVWTLDWAGWKTPEVDLPAMYVAQIKEEETFGGILDFTDSTT